MTLNHHSGLQTEGIFSQILQGPESYMVYIRTCFQGEASPTLLFTKVWCIFFRHLTIQPNMFHGETICPPKVIRGDILVCKDTHF